MGADFAGIAVRPQKKNNEEQLDGLHRMIGSPTHLGDFRDSVRVLKKNEEERKPLTSLVARCRGMSSKTP